MKETQVLNLKIFQEDSEWLIKMSDTSTARLVLPAVATSDLTHTHTHTDGCVTAFQHLVEI